MTNKKAAKNRAWAAFSKYIRYRDAVRDKSLLDLEQAFCISCGKAYPIQGQGCLQAGHFIGGRNNQVLFDERQVHSQCYNCNINLKGNWVPYRKKMLELYGQATVEEMENGHLDLKKYSLNDYQELEKLYITKLEQLVIDNE